MRFFDCALRSIDADDGGFGGQPPKLKIKVQSVSSVLPSVRQERSFERGVRGENFSTLIESDLRAFRALDKGLVCLKP